MSDTHYISKRAHEALIPSLSLDNFMLAVIQRKQSIITINVRVAAAAMIVAGITTTHICVM